MKHKDEGHGDRNMTGSGIFSRPKDVPNGIKAKSRRGKFGETWWADRWIGVLESFGWGSRLERGKSYARRGQTLSLEIAPGKITAKVQGGAKVPYDVTIALPQPSAKTWEKVLDGLASKAVFAAKLLAGDMPHEIEEAFYAAGTWLFPKTAHELVQTCSCPDPVRPCKHLAAVHFMVAEAFDEDPFLMFALRGRGKDEIAQALRERRAKDTPSGPQATATAPIAAPVEEPIVLDPERFFELRSELSQESVALDPPSPAVTAFGPLKLDPPEDVLPKLEAIVARVRTGALALAFGSPKEEE